MYVYYVTLQVHVIISRDGKQLADVYRKVPGEQKLIQKHGELI